MAYETIVVHNLVIKSGQDLRIMSNVTLKYYESDTGKILQVEGETVSYLLKTMDVSDLQMGQIKFYVVDGEINIQFNTINEAVKVKEWIATEKSLSLEHKIQIKNKNQLIEDSFSIDLRKNRDIEIDSKEFLKREVFKLIEDYKKPQAKVYYGPYTVISQSSGFGKSKACLSLIKDYFVVYCCLRNKESSGYPKRSFFADELLRNQNSSKEFKCYFNVYIDKLNEQRNKIDCEQFFGKYGNGEATRENRLADLFATNVSQAKDDVSLSTYVGDKPLLFIFDEASNLLPTYFFTIRSFLSDLEKNIFVLFLDTFSELSGFMPSKAVDPSERVRKQNEKIFDPIYLLPNWDVFANDSTIKTMSDTINFENVCKYGRVLWGSWMETKSKYCDKYKSVKNRELVLLAIEKLICGKDVLDKFDDSDYLAIISSRVGIVKPKLLSTRQQLVAKNMAVCTYASVEKGVFEIDYPSEPILAAAAAELMNGKERFAEILDTLIKNVESSLIAQGDKGEIIAKLILLRAIDHAFNNSENSREVSVYFNMVRVGYFLQSLYGKCTEKCGNSHNKWVCKSTNKFCCIKLINHQLNKYSRQLLDGYVNFNHFAKTDSTMEFTSLVKALKRCAAIECKKNQKAIDLVIPVSLDDFDSISAIMVQVKLHHDPSKTTFEAAFEGVSSDKFYDLGTKNPYLMLYMQLGGDKCEIENIKNSCLMDDESKKQALIYSQGISDQLFPNLGQGIDNKLRIFRVTDRKLFDLQTEKEKSLIYKAIRFSIRSKKFNLD